MYTVFHQSYALKHNVDFLHTETTLFVQSLYFLQASRANLVLQTEVL